MGVLVAAVFLWAAVGGKRHPEPAPRGNLCYKTGREREGGESELRGSQQAAQHLLGQNTAASAQLPADTVKKRTKTTV